MIKGIGTDVVEIQRLSLTPAFVERILTLDEQALLASFTADARKLAFLAGRFAAKEALMKALGTGIGTYGFQDFNIVPNALGQPTCLLAGHIVHLSISHDAGVAMAFVVLEHA
jgi:holo-[acyl-carrier protein] synthase